MVRIGATPDAASILTLPLGERREPSLQLCAAECGSRCCRAPFTVELSTVELPAFKKAAAARGVTPRAECTGSRMFTIRFEETGGSCPMLEADGSCGIYDDRPAACRMFPQHPNPHCLVWPGTRIDLLAIVPRGQ